MAGKFSVTYVKSHPVMFGVIFLVFGLLLWMLLSRHPSPAAASAQAGPDPNAVLAAQVQMTGQQLQAQTQVQLAQIAAGSNQDNNSAQIQLAGLALQGQVDSINANFKLSEDQLVASTQALAMQLKNNLDITNSNNSFMIDYAKNAQDAATAQLMIGASLQEQLSADQLDAYKFGTLANSISTLKEGKRDNAFALLTATESGAQLTGSDITSIMAPNGSHNTHIGSILSTLAPVAIAFAG